MEKPLGVPPQPFKTPQEELTFLRERVRDIEKDRNENVKNYNNPDNSIRDTIYDYKKTDISSTIDSSLALSKKEVEGIALGLEPEAHDSQVIEIQNIISTKGIKNALSVVAKLNNPHLDDDLHRFLAQYIKSGQELDGIKGSSKIESALRMTLYELEIPIQNTDEGGNLSELISAMEHFYSGMLSVSSKKDDLYFTLELAVEHVGQEVKVFASVPDGMRDLFEKTLTSFFPRVKAIERKNDYNIFTDGGVSISSYATYSKKNIFPIKTYDKFDHDPITAILNSFSRLQHEGEGAALQIVVKPIGDKYTWHYKEALKRIEGGASVSDAINVDFTVGQKFMTAGKELFSMKSSAGGNISKKKNDEEGRTDLEKDAMDRIREKTGSPIVATNIRLVVSAREESHAQNILNTIEASFNQFNDPHGNSISFKEFKKGNMTDSFHDFAFRLFSPKHVVPLNTKELSTLIHIPTRSDVLSREVKQTKSARATAPLNASNTGILLGVNDDQGSQKEIKISPKDRLRHMYVIGQTGTGKTTLLKNMIIEDIQNGEGVCMIDPHGSDIQDILGAIPESRQDDVIYFDPSYTERPIGLNMLEYDVRFPEQKTFVVNEMLSIFNKLFDMKTAGGPMFEQYFRNSVLLVMESPETGNTLLDVSRVLSDKSFREMKLSQSKNPVVVQYWREVAEKAGGEASLQNIVPYITSKFDVFLSNDIMRPIIAQEKSSFDFREIMDNKKILLVNLSKGRLGDINANLLGLIIVGKILMAALSRVDNLSGNLPPFYLYIDEFQNITTDSISTILSEARKYSLGLTIAHQFIAQLDDGIRDSVFGNVGSIVSYRVGTDDAEYLEKQFSPVFEAKDLMNIDNYNAYVKMLSDGQPIKPFDIKVRPFVGANPATAKQMMEVSHLKHGRNRDEVEAEIMSKYTLTKKTPEPGDGKVV